MQKIRIVADSATDMVAPYPQGVTVVPMGVSFGDEHHLDGVDITHQEFYEKLIETDALPTTSLVSPLAFENAFREAVEAGETVIAITISSKLSGTYQSALIAAQQFPDQVHVVDSLSAAIGEQVLVRRAVELMQSGASAEYIVCALEREKNDVRIMALLDTLEYLKKGGRVSSTIALVGGMLSVKPVLTINDGEVIMLGKARGSKNGNNYLIKEIEKSGGVDFDRPLCLSYTGLTDTLLQKYIKDSKTLWEGHEDCLHIGTMGATIGTHAGPGAIAVAFFCK